ncbi:MAG TPA: hypothetical protein VK348_06715 [Planctomycetota bacterium]|nr:hypothetical protein [Planctomycetota bacterium]
MKAKRLLALAAVIPCSGCFQLEVTAQAGYTSMALSGHAAIANTSSGVSSSNDVDSALGLGDAAGSPYGRVQLDFGVPVLTASVFKFSQEGTGRVTADFGNITAGTDVVSKADFLAAKVSYAFDVGIGPVTIAPGVAVDVFDLDMSVHDQTGAVSEDIKALAPVPMAFLRGGLDLGIVAAVVEGGYISIPKIGDAKGKFWDLEAMLEMRPTAMFHLFGGYRIINLEAQGDESSGGSNNHFDVGMRVSGWQIGGGLRF